MVIRAVSPGRSGVTASKSIQGQRYTLHFYAWVQCPGVDSLHRARNQDNHIVLYTRASYCSYDGPMCVRGARAPPRHARRARRCARTRGRGAPTSLSVCASPDRIARPLRRWRQPWTVGIPDHGISTRRPRAARRSTTATWCRRRPRPPSSALALPSVPSASCLKKKLECEGHVQRQVDEGVGVPCARAHAEERVRAVALLAAVAAGGRAAPRRRASRDAIAGCVLFT